MRTLSILTAMLDTLVSQWNQNKMLMLKPNTDNLIESNHCALSIQYFKLPNINAKTFNFGPAYLPNMLITFNMLSRDSLVEQKSVVSILTVTHFTFCITIFMQYNTGDCNENKQKSRQWATLTKTSILNLKNLVFQPRFKTELSISLYITVGTFIYTLPSFCLYLGLGAIPSALVSRVLPWLPGLISKESTPVPVVNKANLFRNWQSSFLTWLLTSKYLP